MCCLHRVSVGGGGGGGGGVKLNRKSIYDFDATELHICVFIHLSSSRYHLVILSKTEYIKSVSSELNKGPWDSRHYIFVSCSVRDSDITNTSNRFVQS